MRSFLFLFLLLASNAMAQEYTVLHLKGEIIRVQTDTPLKQGDKISDDEQISFKSSDAMAAVLSSSKGRYIIKPGKGPSEKSNELIYILKSTITPVRGGMSTRAAGIQNPLDFQLYFNDKPYVWAGEFIKLEISSSGFPMNEKSFFYMSYTYNEEVINKMLEYEADDLFIKKSTLFQIDDTPILPDKASNFNLYYYKVESKESTLITPINFVLIDNNKLNILFNQLKDEGDDTYDLIADILSDLYGKCDPMQVRYNLANN